MSKTAVCYNSSSPVLQFLQTITVNCTSYSQVATHRGNLWGIIGKCKRIALKLLTIRSRKNERSSLQEKVAKQFLNGSKHLQIEIQVTQNYVLLQRYFVPFHRNKICHLIFRFYAELLILHPPQYLQQNICFITVCLAVSVLMESALLSFLMALTFENIFPTSEVL